MNKKLKLKELNRISPEEFITSNKIPLVVVLDNIRSGHNVGSVFRTSDAYVVEKIILTGISPQPPHKDIQKTALGATETVRWDYFEDSITAIDSLKKQGYQIISIEQTEKAISLIDYNLPENNKVAIVMGNEVKGVQQSVIDQSDICIELPQFGTKHSLNVSVCSGIVIWEMWRRLMNK